MSILTSKVPVRATPSELAGEHADALTTYQQARDSVIARGRQSVEEIVALEAELAAERQAHESVLHTIQG